MIKLIKKILNWGINTEQTPLEQRRIRLLNIACWLGIISNLAYTIFFLILADYLPVATNLIAIFILFGLLKLNKKGKYHIARLGFCLDIPIYFVVMALGLGKEIGIELYFIVTAIMPILFFDRWKVIIPFFIMNLLLFISVKLGYDYVEPYFYPKTNYFLEVRLSNRINIFILLFIIIGSFKEELVAYQKSIEEQGRILKENNEEIRSQNLVIEEKSKTLEQTYNHIRDSITYAQRIQNALLGSPSNIKNYFQESFLFFQPKDIVSGDFYWFYQDEENNVSVLVVADCTGHGVPGAFMTIMGSNFLDEIIREQKNYDPSKILYQLDHKITTSLKQINSKVNDGMDVGVLVFKRNDYKVQFAGAKNPLWVVRDSEMLQYKGSKFPIGSSQYKTAKEFETQTISVIKGDMLYLFSDGFQDQFGGKKNTKYLKKRFREQLLLLASEDIPTQHQKLEHEINTWKNTMPQTDDICVAGIRVV
ncbi:PP2C family protein-serine/threonine phosphatase [Bernardetia sp.]|uniref:PP2C family protein-serine/threonine phosphatase n=1 Tax=Bernardetia sp. TaxID=1937974 RepID=UPI0025C22C3E|nr:SpoIIE family protein phosphatase [Bernardetia sp.]